MMIRRETEQDFPALYNLVKAAFQTAKVSNGDEQEFVNRLRSGGGYIPEIALAAEDDGVLIGHIMLTRIKIAGDEHSYETLLLAPLSVILEHRNRGVGACLVEESFRRARELGYTSVFSSASPHITAGSGSNHQLNTASRTGMEFRTGMSWHASSFPAR